ncbi:hypothetical protein FS837_011540 [Tulasnella sp. UAMH 9824]|nr:hypothetical protein FS837_011540 [Tulasnella sp. UAMH 9824]
MQANQKYSITKTFRSINVWLCASRVLLGCQYVRVAWYRRRSGQNWSKRFWFTPVATFTAAAIFFGCYWIIEKQPDSKGAAIAQLSVWVVAILLQVVAAAFTPNDHPGALKSDSAMAPRLASLTVIILGRVLSFPSVSMELMVILVPFTPILYAFQTMFWQSVAVLFILYFIWLLYFDGFKIKQSTSRGLEELWLYLHFPLHFTLIMLLEGVKNVYIYVNVLEAFNRLMDAFNEVWEEYGRTDKFPDHPTLEKLLRVLDTSWQEEKSTLLDAIDKDAADPLDQGINVAGQIWRWYGDMIHKVILLYNEEEDKKAEYKYQIFAQSNNTVLMNDLDGDGALFNDFFNSYLETMAYTGRWIVIVAGLLVLSMAVINTVQRRPRNRFASIYSLNRIIVAAILISLGSVRSTDWWIYDEKWMDQVLPAIAIAYFVGVFVDFAALKLSIRSIKKLELLYPLLPTSQYGHEQSQQSESPPIGPDAQGRKGSSGLLCATEGEAEKSHGEKSISSSV